MGEEFAEAVVARVRAARLAVREAVAVADSFAVSAAMDELEDALLLARRNGMDVPQDGAADEVRGGRERG
jgi:hypothetical protein